MGAQISTGVATVTATGELVAGPGTLIGYLLEGAAGAGTVVLRDDDGSGAVLLNLATPAGAGAGQIQHIPGQGIVFPTALHATVTGTARVTVFYS